jgi:hypothetical protein
MKPWLPALAGLLVAVGLATTAGVLFGGLAPGPGGSTPIALKSMSAGTQDAAHLRLTQPALPVECQAAAWVHVTLAGRCPISRSAAEAVARSAQPIFPGLPIVIAGGAAYTGGPAAPAANTGAGRQVREAVLAWADLPAGTLAGSPAQALHALVWVVAVDEPASFSVGCPPIVRTSPLMIRCGGASKYLVFVDALSGKSRLMTNRP